MRGIRRLAGWPWRVVISAARWVSHFLVSLIFFVPVALIAYVLYLQRTLLETKPIDAATVALLTLLIITFVLWRGGPTLISRIQELGPLKLAPRVEREVERVRPEIENALGEMDRLDRLLAGRMYLDYKLPREDEVVVDRALNRLNPLLTAIRLIQDPKSFSEDLRASYGLLSYWEGRLLYHLGYLDDAIAKWTSVWQIVGPEVLSKLGSPKLHVGDLCVFVGNAYVLRLLTNQAEREPALRAAVGWYRWALEYDPDSMDALFNLAWVYDELRIYGQAVATLDRLLSANPTLEGALYNRACAKAKAGQLDEAMQDLRRLPCPHSVWEVARTDDDLTALRSGRHADALAALVQQCAPPPTDQPQM